MLLMQEHQVRITSLEKDLSTEEATGRLLRVFLQQQTGLLKQALSKKSTLISLLGSATNVRATLSKELEDAQADVTTAQEEASTLKELNKKQDDFAQVNSVAWLLLHHFQA